MDDILDDYKLHTTFHPDHILHTTYIRDPNLGLRKVAVERKWFPKHELGAGAFGTVHLQATDEGEQRAVKAIRKTLARKYGVDHKRELAALAVFSRAKHQRLKVFVEFFGWFEDPDCIFLAMEYLPHGDLSNYISTGISEIDARGITLQLLEGLEIMHEKGFTHRDLKPQNIFVVQSAPSWWVKIGDFGISKRIMPDSSTELRTTIGTMGYEAPEVRHYIDVDEEDNDKGHVYTNAVDIWSLGCVVYQIRARQLPFPTSRQLKRYCSGKDSFPTQPLIENTSDKGILFLKDLLVPTPSLRLTASEALKNDWLRSEDLSDISTRPRQFNIPESQDVAIGNARLPHAPSIPPYVEETAISMNQSTSKSMPENLPGSSRSWYASSPRIEPNNNTSFDGDHQMEERDPIETSRDLIDFLFPKDDNVRSHPLEFRAELQPENDLKVRANVGRRELVKAAKQANLQLVENLLETGVDVNSTDSNGHSALHVAADMGQLNMVRRLLRARPNIDGVDCMDGTALQAAAECGHLEVVKVLLLAKADVNKMGRFQTRTALRVAAENGHSAVVEELLSAGANVNGISGYLTPLWSAAKEGHADVVELLLVANADVNQINVEGRTALDAAAGAGHLKVVDLLINAKALVNADPGMDRTALQAAAGWGYLNVVKRLLLANADVNAPAGRDFSGLTALQAASGGGHLEIVEGLLVHGADVNAKNRFGRTALECAAGEGHLHVVETLLLCSPNVNAEAGPDWSGLTALQAASMEGHLMVVDGLLKAGADVNANASIGHDGLTALQAAAGGGHLEVVRKLLLVGADVNATNFWGLTALRAAVGHVVSRPWKASWTQRKRLSRQSEPGVADNLLKIVVTLVHANADVNAADSRALDGRTALQEATRQGQLEVIDVLKEAGSRTPLIKS